VPTLFVKCEACGGEFPTPIGQPEGAATGIIISGLRLRCPKCGQERAYDTSDFHFPRVKGGPPPGNQAEAEENIQGEDRAMAEEPATRLAGAVVPNPEARPPRGE